MKKAVALAIASAMTVGMTTAAFAADPKATGFATGKTLADGYVSLGTSYARPIQPGTATNQTVSYTRDIVPNEDLEDYIYLTNDMFAGTDWYATGTTASGAPLSAKDIRTSKMAVRTSVSAGSKAIETVDIDTRNSRIEIEYVDEYVSTSELDFDFTVYLTIDTKRWTDQGLTFVGTLANEITEVYADDDYVDTSAGQIAHAQDFVRAIEVDLGNGVSIFTKMFKDKKYYGISTRDADEADDRVFAQYPDVDNVITLKTVGLNATGDIVRLTTDYGDYYVYDKDMNFLGRATEMLPYSSKYYLANRQLNLTTNQNVTPPEEEIEAPTTTGPTTTGNVNYNPNTGC